MFGYNFEVEYTSFIKELVRATGCETYIELGISKGDNMYQIAPYCGRPIGVDVVDVREYYNFEFYHGSTDAFFKTHDVKADIIFIDADHEFNAVKRDFVNSLKILNEYGIILLHDTDPVSEEYLSPELCNDSYRMIEWIRGEYPKLNMATIPISVMGLTIINRHKDRRVNKIKGL